MSLQLSNRSRLMIHRSWFCVLILMVPLAIDTDAFARGGGGRGGGGGGRGGGGASASRSPSMSRPTSSASRPSAPASRPSAPASRPSPSTSRPSSSPSRPTASPSRPNSSGTRPGTTPSRPNLPNGGTRPSVPGSGSIGSGASRPNLDAGKVGSGGRPSQSQLQNFLDLPASGGSSNRPGAATRPADGVRPMPANNAASDFLQNRGPQTGQLPGLADRTDLPGRAETRPASGENRLGNVDRVNPADRQDRVDSRGDRTADRVDGRDDRTGARQDRRTTATENRAARVEDMSQRTQDRYDRRDEVREQMHDHYPRYDFWKDHPDYARYRWNHPYHWATWAAVTNWFPWGWSNARQYNYGGNVYYDNSTVYYEGQPVATADEYAQQAMTIAESTPEPAASSDWMSLGVFALTQDGEASGPAPTQFLQLAISKEGAVAGTFNNSTTDKSQEVEGAVDKESQRVAWVATGKQWPVMEAGISGLTEDQTPVLIHFENGETQQWLMVRLEEPEAPAGAAN